ncbi:hypothetical protein HJG60_010304 [Phyllostomus discolor]|uniref:Uncharacterized protein n=1 Tax=Phyllostomus discolor TaxID=89673 RepID=A0A834EMU0_9CHIR|nr:hypothetical protein HJG60_010304 [Phyllostomus discolor]
MTFFEAFTLPSPSCLTGSTGALSGDHAQDTGFRDQGSPQVMLGVLGPTPPAPNQLCLWPFSGGTPSLDIQSQAPVFQNHLKVSLPSKRTTLYTKSFTKSKIILFTFSDFCFHKVFSKHAKATECLVGHDMQR